MAHYLSIYRNTRKSYCKKRSKKIAALSLVYNKHGKINDVLKLNWLPVEDRMCMNTAKLAYLGLHDQIFPYQLKLWCKTMTRNSSSKEFQKNNTEFRMSSNLIYVLCPGGMLVFVIFCSRVPFSKDSCRCKLVH